MHTLISLPLFLALSAPAHAGPILWHTVPDHQVDEVYHAEMKLHDEQSTLDDRRWAVDQRKQGIEAAREARKEARADRKMARSDRNEDRRHWRRAKRGHGDLAVATMAYEAAQRTFLEARDQVDLDKEHVRFATSRKHLAKGREARARADLELAQAQLAGKDLTRFERQLARLSDEVAARRSEHEIARVAVNERHQDYLGTPGYGAPIVAVPSPAQIWAYLPSPGTEAADDAHDQPDEQAMAAWRHVHFDLGSATLDDEATQALDQAATYLTQHRDQSLVLEGHTDKTGSHAFNRQLAWDRAETVQNYLMHRGVWSSQLDTEAYGETDPMVDVAGASELNRRVELRADEADASADAGS